MASHGSVQGRATYPQPSGTISVAPIKGLLAGIYLLAVVVGIAAGTCVGYRSRVAALDYDELEYWHLAQAFLTSGDLPVGRRTPAFPMFVGLLQWLLSDFHAVELALSAVSAINAPLLALLAYRMTGDRITALLAGVGMALWPPALFFGSSLYSETLALPIFLLFLVALPFPGASGSPARLLLAGAILGLCALVRPMYQLFFFVLPLVLLLDLRSLRPALRAFTVILAGFLVTVLPWSAYASVKSGHVMLLSANGGETLAGGFNGQLLVQPPPALHYERRDVWGGPGKWISSDKTGFLTPAEEQADYFAKDRMLRERAVHWILEHPLDAGYLLLRKLAYMWGYYPWAEEDWRKLLFGNIPVIVLQCLFVWAVASSRQVRAMAARFYMLPLFVIGVAAISWGSWRFRQPADAGMLLVSAMAIVAQLRRHSLSPEPVAQTGGFGAQ